MLKNHDSMKDLTGVAAQTLRELLGQVPPISLGQVEFDTPLGDNRADFLVRFDVRNQTHVLICEVKSDGQPRNVRWALHQLNDYVQHLGEPALPVLIAPYLSPESQRLCREEGAGYLDLHGNARIVFDGIFIERIAAGKPPTERRDLKSLFKPKAAQVLRVLLRDPSRAWKVSQLAEEASVSLGHVSNVRSGLLAREWGHVSEQGLFLAEPDALLDAWRAEYEPPVGKRIAYYTPLHGSAFEGAVRPALHAGPGGGQAILASFSAAQWLAPYGRTGIHSFYADREGLEKLKACLSLAAAPKGENVVVTLPKDEGLFRDTLKPADGVVCTGAVQTYLDLAAAGERGHEAAEHLRQERLTWRK